jgi:hypothetical protein
LFSLVLPFLAPPWTTIDLGELEEDEEYDSQEEKRRSGPVVLGEEAKKSKRARSRSVTVKKKAPEEVAVLAEGAGVATPASVKKVKTKRTPTTAEEETPIQRSRLRL